MLPRSAITLFCDDIREEKSGMDTLIGVYPDNVNVPKFPFSFPKIALYTRINIDVMDSPGDISIKLSIPNKDDELLATLDTKTIRKSQAQSKRKGSPMVGLISKAVASHFVVPAPGQVKMTIIIQEQEYVGGVLNIKQTPKSASPSA